MHFTIHAAGSLGNRPDIGKRPYRLKFAVITDPHPTKAEVLGGLRRALEETERVLAKQGFRLVGEDTVRFESRQARVEPVDIHIVRQPSARDMLPRVMQGDRFRADGGTIATEMPVLAVAESWEWLFSGVFVRDAIWMEYPDAHEERDALIRARN